VRIRRIVVGLDVAPHSRSALAAAAAIARELDAELEALFVESEELHGLAGLPFAREMGFPSASVRRIDPEALERSLQARMREATRALASRDDARPVRWSFRVARGTVAEQLLAASVGADLTVVSVAGWGPQALQLVQDAATTLVVLPRGAAAGRPFAAICPVDVPPAQAIPLLCSLANAVGNGLTLLALGDGEGAERWRGEAAALLKKLGRKARIDIVPGGQREALQAALDRLAPRALALVAPAHRPDR
jgi:hypothetical protein